MRKVQGPAPKPEGGARIRAVYHDNGAIAVMIEIEKGPHFMRPSDAKRLGEYLIEIAEDAMERERTKHVA